MDWAGIRESSLDSAVASAVDTVVSTHICLAIRILGKSMMTPIDMQQIERQVAACAVKQFQIAKRSRNAMNAYVNAGLVAEPI
jgi:hypothetical protein